MSPQPQLNFRPSPALLEALERRRLLVIDGARSADEAQRNREPVSAVARRSLERFVALQDEALENIRRALDFRIGEWRTLLDALPEGFPDSFVINYDTELHDQLAAVIADEMQWYEADGYNLHERVEHKEALWNDAKRVLGKLESLSSFELATLTDALRVVQANPHLSPDDRLVYAGLLAPAADSDNDAETSSAR